MGRCVSSFAAATTTATVLAFATQAWAEAYICRFDEVVRRVELRVDDPQARVPCQVVYWRENQEPRVLWHARSDPDFCETKAQELVQQLESGGWRCESDEMPAAAATAPQETAPRGDAAALPAPGAGSNGRAPEGEATPDRDELRALLQEAIARDVARLSELTTGAFDARIAALGDLDGDGIDDAAVVMTYTSGADRTRYLVAYMFRDRGYLPVARMAIGDAQEGARGAEVEAIEGGAIRLEWRHEEAEAGADGGSRAAFVVQDGKLVEVPTS